MPNADRFVIVVGTDFSDLATRALDQALEVATFRSGAEVHVVHVEPDVWVGSASATLLQNVMSTDAAIQQVQQVATRQLETMPARLQKAQIRRVFAHVRRGSPAENLAQIAADLDADLVIVGSHGHRGMQPQFLGSVAERLARLARCPVWIARPKDHVGWARVVDVEPSCPDCLATRNETGGAKFWCARHLERHARQHSVPYATEHPFSLDTVVYETKPEPRSEG